MLKHFIQKWFATKIKTPCRISLQVVADDIQHFKTQYESIGMRLIDISYKEYIQKTNCIDDAGNIWLDKTHMSYAMLYFVCK